MVSCVTAMKVGMEKRGMARQVHARLDIGDVSRQLGM